MTTLAMSALFALAAALPASAQVPKHAARDLFMHSTRVPNVEVRFVDYHWQPALFAAMQQGSADVPEARRDWVVARVIIEQRPMTLEGKRLPVGNYALTLWPSLDGQGMAYELRQVDMREVYPDLNAMAPAPRGETHYKGPARFAPSSPPAERLTVTATEQQGAILLTISYGDKQLPVKFTP
ncbi:MAG TPA: hypothetical protein VMX54_02000 [Vicinamibacteria bacterium]|nr:hypothetical protein [Vicinamibacteria bacterium]